MTDEQKQLDAAIAAGCPGVDSLHPYAKGLHPTEKPAPMTWEQFVEMAVREGWIHKYEFYITRTISHGTELTIFKSEGFEIKEEGRSVWLPSQSYELAYAAANALAEATGGWA